MVKKIVNLTEPSTISYSLRPISSHSVSDPFSMIWSLIELTIPQSCSWIISVRLCSALHGAFLEPTEVRKSRFQVYELCSHIGDPSLEILNHVQCKIICHFLD